ncbi:MAG: hypothetical protein NC217_05380 [Muribaculaceae bacterium]|nr:hypothetical protein [Muribaculaceae bacterium]
MGKESKEKMRLQGVQVVIDMDELLGRVRSEVACLNLSLVPDLNSDKPRISWRDYNDSTILSAETEELMEDLKGKFSAWNAGTKKNGQNISIILYVNNHGVKALASIEAHINMYLKCRLLAKKLELAPQEVARQTQAHHERLMERATSLLNDIYEVLCMTEY